MLREFREGFQPLPDWEGLLRNAHWSDAFFNYVLAEQSWDDDKALAECAATFIEVNPECPYTAAALVVDFRDRL